MTETRLPDDGQPKKDRLLVDPYAIIMVNPEKQPHVNQAGAKHLVEWITSPRGQALIEDYPV